MCIRDRNQSGKSFTGGSGFGSGFHCWRCSSTFGHPFCSRSKYGILAVRIYHRFPWNFRHRFRKSWWFKYYEGDYENYHLGNHRDDFICFGWISFRGECCLKLNEFRFWIKNFKKCFQNQKSFLYLSQWKQQTTIGGGFKTLKVLNTILLLKNIETKNLEKGFDIYVEAFFLSLRANRSNCLLYTSRCV